MREGRREGGKEGMSEGGKERGREGKRGNRNDSNDNSPLFLLSNYLSTDETPFLLSAHSVHLDNLLRTKVYFHL